MGDASFGVAIDLVQGGTRRQLCKNHGNGTSTAHLAEQGGAARASHVVLIYATRLATF